MTDDRMTLTELVEKAADADLVREMLAFAADRMMDAEVATETCAAKGTRSPCTRTSATAIASATGTPASVGSR